MPVSTWLGIEVKGTRVTSISLDFGPAGGNNLVGPITHTIGTLDSLEYLSFASNDLTGTIPQSYGNLHKLKYIDLSFNQLTGTIPDTLSQLRNLEYLRFDYNQLTGTIPDWLGQLTNLQNLSLEGNQFTDTIPASLGNLVNLQYLDLQANQLTGSIPSSLGNLTKMQGLVLGDNSLTGTIPLSFGNFKDIHQLTINNNLLEGSIPDTIGTLIQLNTLYVDYNKLSGTVPPLDKLVNLYVLGFSYNELSGPVPSLAPLSKLFYLLTNHNKFTFDGYEELAKKLGNDSTYPNASGLTNKYAPQATIPLQTGTSPGGAIRFYVSAGGTVAKNTFRWYRNGNLSKTIIGDSSYTPDSTGSYYVTVTNSVAAQLTLHSDTAEGVLPVTLLSFTATKNGAQNLLQWSTASEINSNYFEVQKSTNAVDFVEIGKVNAAGNNNTKHDYSYIDSKPASGTNYYRLKQVDNDGRFTLSAVKTITGAASFAVNIYPNPVQANLNLNFNSDEMQRIQIKIVNAAGKIVSTRQYNVAAGTSTNSINISSLSKGVYYLECKSAKGETRVKFVKAN